jgi:hypothetical protein
LSFYTGGIGRRRPHVHEIWIWRRAYLSGFARSVAVSPVKSPAAARNAGTAATTGLVVKAARGVISRTTATLRELFAPAL